MRERGHEYIHFVDLQNRDASIADPYCVGLLKQHNQNEKGHLFDIKGNPALSEKAKGLSLLNRFSFADQSQGNFALFMNEKPCWADSLDQQYLDHFNMDAFNRKFEFIWVGRRITPEPVRPAPVAAPKRQLADGYLRAARVPGK